MKKTDGQVKASYIENYGLAKSAISNSEPLLAAERYKHILNTYSIYYGLDSIQNHLHNLIKSTIYVNALNQRKKAFEKEVVLVEKLISRYMMEFDNPKSINLRWWERELEKLDKLDAKSNPETQKMLERVQFKLFASAYETNNSDSNITVAQKQFRKTILSKIKIKYDFICCFNKK